MYSLETFKLITEIAEKFDYTEDKHQRMRKRHTGKSTEALVTEQRKKEKNEFNRGYRTLEKMYELGSSTFHEPYDQTINASVRSALLVHIVKITEWAKNPWTGNRKDDFELEYDCGHIIGSQITYGAKEVEDCTHIRVILRKSADNIAVSSCYPIAPRVKNSETAKNVIISILNYIKRLLKIF